MMTHDVPTEFSDPDAILALVLTVVGVLYFICEIFN